MPPPSRILRATNIISHRLILCSSCPGVPRRGIFHPPPTRSMASYTLPQTGIFENLLSHDPRTTAVIDHKHGSVFTYGHLLKDVAHVSVRLRDAGLGKEKGERVAFLVESGYEYVVTFLAALAGNAVALPLASSFPTGELRYILNDSRAAMLIASEEAQGKAKEVVKDGVEHSVQLGRVADFLGGRPEADVQALSRANEGGLMLYTSGTTSRPKGVVLPSSALVAQTASLQKAWKYTPDDHLLHVLPLHHIHGCINALLTPLVAGSKIEMMYPFNAKQVWERLAQPYLDPPSAKPITFFTAVPTIYTRLQATFAELSPEIQKAAQAAISPENMRVTISGSAALPTPVKTAWKELSNGTVLLERYGMTEIGMALSCGLDFADRVDGSVGWPLPGVEVRLVDVDTNETVTSDEGEGEIQVRGDTIFTEYWNKPEATATEFIAVDGENPWFKTGDIAKRVFVEGAGNSSQDWAKGPMYFILGRKSADIIKTGGEKVSALEIEREMLSLPEISECAVVGVTSAQWGQKVAAVVVLTEKGQTGGRGGKEWSVMDMRRALKDKLVNYKIPQELRVVESIPRNAMGKINKKSLVKEIFPDEEG